MHPGALTGKQIHQHQSNRSVSSWRTASQEMKASQLRPDLSVSSIFEFKRWRMWTAKQACGHLLVLPEILVLHGAPGCSHDIDNTARDTFTTTATILSWISNPKASKLCRMRTRQRCASIHEPLSIDRAEMSRTSTPAER